MMMFPARMAACVLGFAIGASALAGEPHDVSVIGLIATPERYNGEEVRLIGFLHLEFEGDAIYLHQEDFERAVTVNSLGIDPSDAQKRSWANLNNRYVVIEDRFSSLNRGHFGARPGSIEQITRLADWTVKRAVDKPSTKNRDQGGIKAVHNRRSINSR